MNRHTKLAIFIAPFLAIGGFIAADYYSQSKASKEKIIHQLIVQGNCNLKRNACTLQGGGLKLNLSDKDGMTTLISSHPLDNVVIASVANDNPQQMAPNQDRLKWIITWEIYRPATSTAQNKLRVVATVKNQVFISEFTHQED